MSIAFRCPSCDKTFELADTMAGKAFRCWQCHADMTIPVAETKARTVTIRRDDDDSDVEDRQTVRKRKFRKKPKTNNGLVVGLMVGSFFLLLILVVGVVWIGVKMMAKDNNNVVQNGPFPQQQNNPINNFNNNQPNQPPKPKQVSDEDIARQNPMATEKINLGAARNTFGIGRMQIPYTVTLADNQGIGGGAPPVPQGPPGGPPFGPKGPIGPRFGPQMGPKYHFVNVMMVTVDAEGNKRESMIMGSFVWEKEGTLEYTVFGGGTPRGLRMFLSEGGSRISNIITLP